MNTIIDLEKHAGRAVSFQARIITTSPHGSDCARAVRFSDHTGEIWMSLPPGRRFRASNLQWRVVSVWGRCSENAWQSDGVLYGLDDVNGYDLHHPTSALSRFMCPATALEDLDLFAEFAQKLDDDISRFVISEMCIQCGFEIMRVSGGRGHQQTGGYIRQLANALRNIDSLNMGSVDRKRDVVLGACMIAFWRVLEASPMACTSATDWISKLRVPNCMAYDWQCTLPRIIRLLTQYRSGRLSVEYMQKFKIVKKIYQ